MNQNEIGTIKLTIVIIGVHKLITITGAENGTEKISLLSNEVYGFALKGLLHYCSPKNNAGRWISAISYSSVCRAVRAGLFPGIKSQIHLRRKDKLYSNQRKLFTQYTENWFYDCNQAANERSRLRDYERDKVYGFVGVDYPIKAVDRRSRLLVT